MGLIYLDSCLVIYLVEHNPKWSDRVRARMGAERGGDFAMSPLVAMECLVQPFRNADLALERSFRAAFAKLAMLEIGAQTFEDASRLRAAFGLKTPDALHLACAQYHRCSALWTNDQRFGAAGSDLVHTLTP